MAAKIFVLDGLARSGTTLLSSIIHSQDISSCYRGVFHEFLACEIGRWKHDYALHKLLGDTDDVVIKNRRSLIDKFLCAFAKDRYVLSYDILASQTLGNVKRRNQTGSISLESWEDTVFTRNAASFEDLDEIYQQVAKKDNVQILGMRWNQGLPFISKFLRNKSHYWISLVRNPMDRALSDYKTFSESYEDALCYTRNSGQLLTQTAGLENHLVVYFENLIKDPEKEVKAIFRFMGEDVDNLNFSLVQQSGESYKVETSDLSDQGKAHTDGVKFVGFDASKIGKYKGIFNQELIKRFQEIIWEYDVYSIYRI